MKQYTLSLVLIFWCVISHSQPDIQWQKAFGGSKDELFENCTPTPDGGYIFIGETESEDGDIAHNFGQTDVWIVKTSSNGVIEWEKTYGDDSIDFGSAIQVTTDGGYIFIGSKQTYFSDMGYTYNHIIAWIVKLDQTGNVQWEKTYGDGDEVGEDIILTQDGGYIFIGGYSPEDYWIVKTDSKGNIEWEKTYGGSATEYARSIKATKDGGYVIGGYSASINGDLTNYKGGGDFWLLRIDNKGNKLWQKSYGGSSYEHILDITITNDNGILAAGRTLSNNGDITINKGYYDAWVIKTDASGNLQWQKTMGGTESDAFSSVIQLANGNYVLTGNTSSSDGDVTHYNGHTDIWLMELYPDGTLKWQKTLGGSDFDNATGIATTRDGTYIICGITLSNDGDAQNSGYHGNWDAWAIELNSTLDISSSDISADINIYPTISKGDVYIELSKGMEVAQVKLFNSSGHLVDENNSVSRNRHFDLSRYAAGTYLFQVSYQGQTSTHKVIYIQ